MSGEPDPQRLIAELNKGLVFFQDKLSEQFHLKIPKGVIHRVDEYRDNYFSYLKDSVYKSNICYLLQTVDFQLWLYKLFRPALSVENAYFYQLMVSLGIVAEATAAALLLDPLIESDASDRSLGQVPEPQAYLRDAIIFQSFEKDIKLLYKLKVIDAGLEDIFQEIRVHIRNAVHIQSWEGRLYQKLTLEVFQERLQQFRDLLAQLKDRVDMRHNADALSEELFGGEIDESVSYRGKVTTYKTRGGFGFISCEEIGRPLFFHISQVNGVDEMDLLKTPVLFQIRHGRRGLEAHNIQAEAS